MSNRTTVRFVPAVVLVACGSTTSSPSPQPVQCGTETCTAAQTCVVPCINDKDCIPFADAGPLCPTGYSQGMVCCYPPAAPPQCVDDVHKLGSACGDGTPNYEIDGGFLGCMCLK